MVIRLPGSNGFCVFRAPRSIVPDSDKNEMPWWDHLLADAAAEAELYGENGWETLELHPGDITLRPDDGGEAVLDALVPDNEFEELAAGAIEGVDSYQVFRSTPADVVALLIVLEVTDRQHATFVPVYYDSTDRQAGETIRNALNDGALTLRLRTLADDRVEVQLDEPGLLTPGD